MDKKTSGKKKLSAEQVEKLLATLEARFKKNMPRHKGLVWDKIAAKLKGNAAKLSSLNMMEETGGEPDVVQFDKKTGEFVFYDCSAETPTGRRSFCYDEAARKARKEHAPENSALGMAKSMGVEVLSESEYRSLQKLGEFDLKTSSWLTTPPEIRKLGGAIFGDRRYNQVFVYHNGVESYYAGRAFRAILRV